MSNLLFFTISQLSPLGNERGPSFEQTLNPLHPRMLCTKFGWNWPSSSGEDENVKSLQTDGHDRQQAIRKAHLSFKAHLSLQLRWAKNQDVIIKKSLFLSVATGRMPLFPINLTPEWIVPKLINKIYQSLWRSRFLSKGQWVSLLCYYLHLEKEWPFIEPITSYLYLRILCAKFYIKRFFKFSMFFFLNYLNLLRSSILKWGIAFHGTT